MNVEIFTSEEQRFVSEHYAYAKDKYEHSVSLGKFHIIEMTRELSSSRLCWVSPICSLPGSKNQRDILVKVVLGAMDRDLVCERCASELREILAVHAAHTGQQTAQTTAPIAK